MRTPMVWLGLLLLGVALGLAGGALWPPPPPAPIELTHRDLSHRDLSHRNGVDPLFRQAVDAAVAAVVAEPSRVEAHERLCLLYEANSAYAEAAACFHNVRQLVPDDPLPRYRIAVSLRELNRPQEAIGELEGLLGVESGFAPGWQLLGNLQMSQDDPSAAYAAFEQARRLAPSSVEPLVGQAEALVGLQRYAEAQPLLEQAVRVEPYHRRARYELGLLYRRAGRFGEAIPNLELGGQTSHGRASLPPLLPDAYSDTLTSLVSTVSGHLSVAESYLGRGQAPSAVSYLESVLQARGDDVRILTRLADAYAAVGDLAQAEQHYRRGLALGPATLELTIGLGNCLVRQGQLDAALIQFDKAIELAPFNAQAYLQRAGTQRALGLTDAALESLRTATQVDPKNPVAHRALADVYLSEGRHQEGLGALLAARLREPANAATELGLVRTFLALDRPEEAATCLGVLRGLAPNLAILDDLAAQIRAKTKERATP